MRMRVPLTMLGLSAICGCGAHGLAGGHTAHMVSSHQETSPSNLVYTWKFHLDSPMLVNVLGPNGTSCSYDASKGSPDFEVHASATVAGAGKHEVKITFNVGAAGSAQPATPIETTTPVMGSGVLFLNAWSNGDKPQPGRYSLLMGPGGQALAIDIGFLGNRP